MAACVSGHVVSKVGAKKGIRMTKIALLGTGLMGFPMSRNLLNAGHVLSVWNRSRSKAEPLGPLGATVCDSPVEAVVGATIVISMLSDGPTSANVQEQAMDGFAKDAVWVEMGSIKPEEARAQAARFAEHGIGYIDAPVSGGTKGAEGATLAIMAGGKAETFASVSAVLSDLGRPVHVGPVGAGQLSKLANQAIVACTIGAVAEAMQSVSIHHAPHKCPILPGPEAPVVVTVG